MPLFSIVIHLVLVIATLLFLAVLFSLLLACSLVLLCAFFSCALICHQKLPHPRDPNFAFSGPEIGHFRSLDLPNLTPNLPVFRYSICPFASASLNKLAETPSPQEIPVFGLFRARNLSVLTPQIDQICPKFRHFLASILSFPSASLNKLAETPSPPGNPSFRPFPGPKSANFDPQN